MGVSGVALMNQTGIQLAASCSVVPVVVGAPFSHKTCVPTVNHSQPLELIVEVFCLELAIAFPTLR